MDGSRFRFFLLLSLSSEKEIESERVSNTDLIISIHLSVMKAVNSPQERIEERSEITLKIFIFYSLSESASHRASVLSLLLNVRFNSLPMYGFLIKVRLVQGRLLVVFLY